LRAVSNRRQKINQFLSTGGTRGYGESIPPLVNLEDNTFTFRPNYVQKLFDNVAGKAV